MSFLTTMGYSVSIEYDAEDGIYFGRLAGISDGVGFHADTIYGLQVAFREAVDDYIFTCASIGKISQKPVLEPRSDIAF